MMRVVVIGNAGGGKSTLARKLAERRGLPHIEIDRLLWQDGWVLTPTEIYMRQHCEIIDGDEWVSTGLANRRRSPTAALHNNEGNRAWFLCNR
jgi:adenylate kinase family enzyme